METASCRPADPYQAVGLDLESLVALLPAELRARDYHRSMTHCGHDLTRIHVGLLYRDDEHPPRCGNPQNVGLVFDAGTGDLIEIRADGVGLGIK